MAVKDFKRLQDVVRTVGQSLEGGRSADDIVINDDLNAVFLRACVDRVPKATPFDCNWALFNERKAGRLGPIAKGRQVENHDDYLHAAEIAARRMEDKYGLTIDRVFCHPQFRLEFDEVASAISPGVSTYLLRKAAFKLRKARKLKPELIKRVANWGRRVHFFTAEQLIDSPDLLPRQPGVYLFRDRTGYLYIGEAENLRNRVSKHMDHSDRKSLARYFWEMGTNDLTVELHAFDPDSDGRRIPCRRAYEAHLIQGRRPRFNIQGNPVRDSQ